MSNARPKAAERPDARPLVKLPPLRSYETKWDLRKLYYRSEQDPRIEADLSAAERAYAGFARKWKSADLTDEASLLRALTDYELLVGLPEITRPGRYFSFRKCLNVNDAAAERALALIAKRLRRASDQILFFTLRLGKFDAKIQRSLLRSPKLSHFHYFLQRLFTGARYDLSEAEEKIIRLKARTGSGMWHEAVEKIISNRTVTFKRREIPLPEAIEMIDLLPLSDRIKLWDLIIAAMKDIGQMAEPELNAIISDARGEDELRGFKKPYSATALAYEHDERSIENLVRTVSAEGFKLSRKFYKLKARYHGVPQLHYTEKYRSIGPEPKISFEAAMETCREVFYGLKDEYGRIFDEMLKQGQIDVWPRAGKQGGAFMSAETNQPIQVFLNHVPNFKSLETLAHEMGHAIHAKRSAGNTPLYDGHSIVTAETASTLFENLVFDAIYDRSSAAEKTVLLHDRITRDIATIERQVAFFNAELEMHETIEARGAMENAELAACMRKHLASYLGPAVGLGPDDGYSYVYIGHLRYGFYVYSYAFGLLMSTIMNQNYQADHRYIDKIDAFLSAGSSAAVADIFKSIGIDTTREDTFKAALKNQAKDIAAFEKLLRNR